MKWGMRIVVVCCGSTLLAQTASAQTTRLTKLNFEEPRTAARQEVRDADPYRAMQAAYQTGEPADYPPTLQGSPLPGTPSSSPAISSGPAAVPAPGTRIIAPAPSSTVIGPAGGGCACGSSPTVIQQRPVPSITYGARPATVYTPAPVVVQQRYVPALPPTTTAVVGAAPAAPIVQAGLPPLLPLTRPAARPVFVSEGLLGQPVVYVPGQPVRNLLRYLTP